MGTGGHAGLLGLVVGRGSLMGARVAGTLEVATGGEDPQRSVDVGSVECNQKMKRSKIGTRRVILHVKEGMWRGSTGAATATDEGCAR